MNTASERGPERAAATRGDAAPLPALRVRSLRVLGIRTRVIEVGPPASSEVVLLLHGNPGSAEDWAFVQPRLARLARAVAIDLPGFGDADRPRAWDYSPLSYAEYVGELIRELGVERVHLVMHDLGGLALLWAVNNPEQFASAVLINTGNLIGFHWHRVARAYRRAGVGELLVALTSRKFFRVALARLNPQPRQLPADVVERIWADYDRGTRRAAMRFYRATPAESMGLLAPMLRTLDRPALAIWGRHDPFIPAEQAHLQRDSFPDAEVVVFEDSGHWPHVDNAQRVTDEIARFLERQFEPSSGTTR
jgi:pimeloyl-ACP methyl ester carboxylesterase